MYAPVRRQRWRSSGKAAQQISLSPSASLVDRRNRQSENYHQQRRIQQQLWLLFNQITLAASDNVMARRQTICWRYRLNDGFIASAAMARAGDSVA